MKEVETHRNRSQRANGLAEARTGLFRATLLFGSIAAALSLIIVPSADRHSRQVAEDRASQTDTIMTGSVRKDPAARYTERRSVLANGQGPCLLFPDGTQRGAC